MLLHGNVKGAALVLFLYWLGIECLFSWHSKMAYIYGYIYRFKYNK